MDKIYYTDGYKYQLAKTYQHVTDIFGFEIETDYLALNKTGLLTIKQGYAWDGASGPTVDTKSSMRGSLVHDALYQLMGIDHRLVKYRIYADDLLYMICCEDGMSSFRAYLWRKAVNWFGGKAAEEADTILEAP